MPTCWDVASWLRCRPLLYEVVSAPAEVKPESENTAPEIKVILRRVSHRKSATEISKTAPVTQ